MYCGSSTGNDGRYADTARALGRLLADRHIRLVYGGGSVGLMGILADACLERGGEVIGIIPRGLFAREVAHHGLTELHEVHSMHERKQLMFDLADAFAALPGGLGTLEEVSEVTTWGQLGLHRKPIVLIDVNGFWRPLSAQLDRACADGFLHPENRALLARVDDVDELLDALGSYDVALVEKWIGRSET